MYYILNITKFNSFSKHFYGKLYSNAGSYVNLANLYNGFYNNNDFKKQFKNLEKRDGVSIKKQKSEKCIIKETLKIIKDRYNSDWLIVFYKGNYSKSRSEYASKLYNR